MTNCPVVSAGQWEIDLEGLHLLRLQGGTLGLFRQEAAEVDVMGEIAQDECVPVTPTFGKMRQEH